MLRRADLGKASIQLECMACIRVLLLNVGVTRRHPTEVQHAVGTVCNTTAGSFAEISNTPSAALHMGQNAS